MGFSVDLSPFFASFPTVQMTMFKGTGNEKTVAVLDGKVSINPGGSMSGIVGDFGYIPGKSKTVKAKATDTDAPEVGSLVHIGEDAWRVLSVSSDQAGIAHSINLGDEFAG